jgi:hypothetical protein
MSITTFSQFKTVLDQALQLSHCSQMYENEPYNVFTVKIVQGWALQLSHNSKYSRLGTATVSQLTSVPGWTSCSHISQVFKTEHDNCLTVDKCPRLSITTFSQFQVFKTGHCKLFHSWQVSEAEHHFLTIPSVQDWALQLFHSWQVSQAEHHVHHISQVFKTEHDNCLTVHKCLEISNSQYIFRGAKS